MRLVEMKVYEKESGKVIRAIRFNEHGLNLIVDLEGDSHSKDNGSTIGKTTFARCINICLGSKSIKDVYNSSDTGDNQVVRDYLVNNKVSLILTLKTKDDKLIKLERCLFQNNLQYINGTLYKKIDDYNRELMNLIFPNAPSGLSFRQIMKKFIRLDDGMSRVFKFNDKFTNNSIYHYVYYYLLGLTLDDKEIELTNQCESLKAKNSEIEAKYEIKSAEELDKLLDLKAEQINTLRTQLDSRDYVEEFAHIDANNLDMINEVDEITSRLYAKKHRLCVLNNRVLREKNKMLNTDIEALQALYADALQNLLNLTKSFNQLVDFHNNMCNVRIENYVKEMDLLEKEIESDEKKLTNLRKTYSKEFVDYKISLSDKTDDPLVEYVNEKVFYEKAKVESEQYKSNIIQLKELTDQIDTFANKEQDEIIKQEIKDYFEEYSIRILNEKYDLTIEEGKDVFPLKSIGSQGQLGQGNLKSLIFALDCSIDKLIEKRGVENPRFFIHDQMENVTIVQLANIFEISRESDFQYVLPILSDRIKELNVSESEVILRLSKKDKFFKI